MAIDYENFYAYAQLPVTPDVFIIPSELRYFVKVSLNSAFSQKCQKQPLTFPSRPPALCLWGSTHGAGGLVSLGEVVGREQKSVVKRLS